MSEEIINRLGFDCSDALAALDALDKKMKQVGETMKGFAATTSSLNGAKLDMMGRIAVNIDRATAATERVTLSWKYLTTRVLYTQALVSYFGRFRRLLEGAASDAIDFQRKIAEISTISDAPPVQLAEASRAVSDQYNIGLLETSAGLYQTLSNSVGDTADSLALMTDAAKFARATSSTLKDSVDLLSGAMKSYHLTVEDTGRISAVFFEGIRTGRITATELANAFGRVGPRAAQLGISLEETVGALSAITVTGMKTSEAVTLLNGVITSLTKPTEEMQAAMRGLGFASAETAVATLGLPRLLQSLADSTDGSAASLARLFPNVRGIGGALALTGQNLREFANNVQAGMDATSKFAESKYLQATASDADKVTREINKLKNALTYDLGQAVLGATADLSVFVGGADEMVRVMKLAGPAIVGLGASTLLFAGHLKAARLEAASLSRALGALAAVPLAIGAGKSIGQWLDAKLAERSAEGLRSLEAANNASLENLRRVEEEKLRTAEQADKARLQSALQLSADLNKTYLSDLANAHRANDALSANTKAALSSILGARQRLVNELSRAASDSRRIVEASQQRIGDLKLGSEDWRFSLKIQGLEDSRRALALIERSSDLAARAAKAMGAAQSPTEVSSAVNLWGSAQRAAEEARSVAQTTEDRRLQVRAVEQITRLMDQQIDSEETLQQMQRQRAEALDNERVRQQAVVDRIREATKALLENVSLFDQQGKLLPTDELSRRAAARQKALNTIVGEAFQAKDFDAMRALGLADLASRLSNEFARDPVRLQLTVEEALRGIQTRIDESFARYKAKLGIDVSGLETAVGRSLSDPEQVARALSEITSKAAELRQQLASQTLVSPELTAKQAELSVIFDRIASWEAKRAGFSGEYSDRLRAGFDGLVASIQTLSRQANIADGDIAKLVQRAIALNDAVQSDIVGRLGFGADMGQIQAALMKLVEIDKLQERLQSTPALNPGTEAALQQYDSILRSMQAASASIRANLQAGAMAGAMASPAIHRATGGPVGTDTAPAWLSPGEFVVNATSAKRFASQLVAMNAGVPVYRSEGGTVNNTTIGDIVVNGSPRPEQTGREVLTAIRRELRRGSGRF